MTSYDILNWENSDVTNWLQTKNFKNYVDVFKSNSINGYDLFQITAEDLKNEFKINNYHDRQTLIREIRKLLIESCKSLLIQ
jgi:hypothetical protein